jgi:MbtH protein
MEPIRAPRFRVVLNDEEQYSIWPTGREIPPGWRDGGVEGTKEECLAHIASIWTDITPKSVRASLVSNPS